MVIYPISDQLERLIESFTDPETGELITTEEEMQAAIEQLQMDFDEKIVDLRNEYINLVSEADALRREKTKLAERQKRAENQADRMKRWLAWLLKGEKFQKDAVKISYRKSETVELEDGFLDWAAHNAPGLVKVEMEPRRQEIKNALKNGYTVEFARMETKNNIQIK